MRFINFSILIIALAVFGFSIRAKADAENYGYRVTSSSKTVIQIARDVYSDERLWKKISYWNNIKPPYSLSVGQVLVLPYAPVNQLPKENLVVGKEVPSPNFMKNQPSVAQQIIKNSGYYTYVVNERAPSLSMVALENYGNKKMASVIAKWNGLAADVKLNLGQNLKLKVKPTLPTADATAVLIGLWAKLGNEEMVLRLGGKSNLVIRKGYTPAVRAKSQATAATPTAPIAATPTPTETALTAATSALTAATSALTAATSALTTATAAQTAAGTSTSEKTTPTPTAATPAVAPAPIETASTPTAAIPAVAVAVAPAPAPTTATLAPAETTPAPTAATPAPAETTPTPTAATPTPAETTPAPATAAPVPEVEAKVKPEIEKQRTPAATNSQKEKNPADEAEPTSENYWLGEENSKIIKSLSNPNSHE